MFVSNQSKAHVKGFIHNGQNVEIPCGKVVEVSEEVGIRLLQTFGFLEEVVKAPEELPFSEDPGVEDDQSEVDPDPVGTVELPDDLPENFLKLKAYARSKGIDVTKEMKKDEILKALGL